MDAARFNPMTYSNELEAAGVDRAQAQGLADLNSGVQETEARLRKDFGNLRLDLAEFKAQMHKEFADFKFDLIKWMFGFWVLQTGTIFAILKYL